MKRSLKDPINVSRESHNSGLASAASLSLHTHSDHIESRCWVGVPRVGCADQPPGPEIELAGWMQMRSFLPAYLQCQLLITLSTSPQSCRRLIISQLSLTQVYTGVSGPVYSRHPFQRKQCVDTSKYIWTRSWSQTLVASRQ